MSTPKISVCSKVQKTKYQAYVLHRFYNRNGELIC